MVLYRLICNKEIKLAESVLDCACPVMHFQVYLLCPHKKLIRQQTVNTDNS